MTKFLLPRWNSFRLQLFQNFLQSPELVWQNMFLFSPFSQISLKHANITFHTKIKQSLCKYTMLSKLSFLLRNKEMNYSQAVFHLSGLGLLGKSLWWLSCPVPPLSPAQSRSLWLRSTSRAAARTQPCASSDWSSPWSWMEGALALERATPLYVSVKSFGANKPSRQPCTLLCAPQCMHLCDLLSPRLYHWFRSHVSAIIHCVNALETSHQMR